MLTLGRAGASKPVCHQAFGCALGVLKARPRLHCSAEGHRASGRLEAKGVYNIASDLLKGSARHRIHRRLAGQTC